MNKSKFTDGRIAFILSRGSVGVCWWVSLRRGYAADLTPVRKRDLLRLGVRSLPAVLLAVLIIVGLRLGFATPTEVAVLSVVYSLVLSLAFYRDLTFERFCRSMVEAGVATGVVMLVIMGSAAVGRILVDRQGAAGSDHP